VASGQSVSISRHGPCAVKLPLKTRVYCATCLFVEAKKRGVHDDSICNFIEDNQRAYSRSPLIGNSQLFLISICCFHPNEIERKVLYYCRRNKPKIYFLKLTLL